MHMFYKLLSILLVITFSVGVLASYTNTANAAVAFDNGDVITVNPGSTAGFTITFNGLIPTTGQDTFLASNNFDTYISTLADGRLRVRIADANKVRQADVVVVAAAIPTGPFNLTVAATPSLLTITADGAILASRTMTGNSVLLPKLINSANTTNFNKSGAFVVDSIDYQDANGTSIFYENGSATTWNTKLQYGAVTDVGTPPTDTTAPVLAEVTPVAATTTDTTPDYTFSTDEAGTVTFAGSCGAPITSVNTGNTTITFGPLAVGTYSDCSLTVTDAAGNVSAALVVSGFTIVSTGTSTNTTLTLIDIPQDRMIYDIDKVNGGNTALVPISGTATAGDVIEGYDPGTGNWNVVATTDATGNWSGSLIVTNIDGAPWRTVSVRLAANPTVFTSGTNTFSPGTIFGMLSQSEFQHMLNTYQNRNFIAANGAMPVLNDDTLQVLYVVNDTAPTAQLLYHNVKNGNNLTASMAQLSNILYQNAPGHKFMFVDFMHSGTSRGSLMNDSDTKRRWTHLEDTVNWVRSRGSEIGIMATSWWAADKSAGYNFPLWYSPFTMCENWDGTPFTLGTKNVRGGNVDHCLWDVTTADPNDPGRGIFSRSRTKYLEFGPNRFLPTTGDMKNATDLVAGGVNFNMVNVERINQTLENFFADPRVQSFSLPWNRLVTYHAIGEFNSTGKLIDYSHPRDNNYDGLLLVARHMAVAVLEPLGYVDYTQPAFTSTTWSVDGSYADVNVTSNNAGTFTTPRLKRGDAPLDTSKSYFTEVLGFEINQGAGWTHSGFTAVWQDQNAGIVRITPTTPFKDGDKVIFGRGGAQMSYTSVQNPIDELLETWKNYPVQDTGIVGYDGIALQPLSPTFTASGIQ